MTHDSASKRHVLDAILRTSFHDFTWKVFSTLNTGREDSYIANWRIEAVCYALEEALAGRIPRLVVNLPPRHSKSTISAVAFTAWLLGHNPKAQILVASHTQRLAAIHSDETRAAMVSDWYRRLFPRTRLSPGSSRTELKTTAGGHRLAVTPGVATMGFGADAIIIDDLLDAMDARSDAEREKVADYIDNALLTRLNKPADSLVVCIHQRLHEDDPAGHLLNTGAYAHLNLPAIAEEAQRIPIGPGRYHQRKAGEALFPQRFGLEELNGIRRERGAAVFQMLYQQNPIAPEGSVLQWDWFGTYEDALERDRYELVVQSWDTASSAEPPASYSVCSTWGFYSRKWHLLDILREPLEYPDLKRACLRLQKHWSADHVLIEDASSGKPLYQDCSDLNWRTFTAIKPEQDKEIRFNAACARVEEGKVLLPRDARWLKAFKTELLGFPKARFKEQADSFSQFLNWAFGPEFYSSLSPHHPIRQERRELHARRREARAKRKLQ